MKPPPCVLTIAGSDSGAGAGIQADARTIQALGGYACTAVTALTAQNKRGVRAWRAVSPALLTAQIESVLEDFSIAAIKTGLLPGPGAVRAVAQALRRHPKIPLVIDPVIGSTSGTRFLSVAGVRVLKRELLPRAALVTPNWPEAGELLGGEVRNVSDAEEAARAMVKKFGCAVLIKGGHGRGPVCRDYLAGTDGTGHWFEHRRIESANTHGTGCVLSAAIAVRLAAGDGLVAAVTRASAFLQSQLRAGRRLRWGGGRGPAFAGIYRIVSSARPVRAGR